MYLLKNEIVMRIIRGKNISQKSEWKLTVNPAKYFGKFLLIIGSVLKNIHCFTHNIEYYT